MKNTECVRAIVHSTKSTMYSDNYNEYVRFEKTVSNRLDKLEDRKD